jgi:hypothetical protein
VSPPRCSVCGPARAWRRAPEAFARFPTAGCGRPVDEDLSRTCRIASERVTGQLSKLKTLCVFGTGMSSRRVELQSPAEEVEHPFGLDGYLRIDFCTYLCQRGLETPHLVAELLDDVGCQFWGDGLAERW